MKGTKRFGQSDSNVDFNDSALRNKRIMAASAFDFNRAEPSGVSERPPLDMQRAKSSQQHVRALNTQFASWVQSQLQNHPDELWEDGVQDYLTHASQIMDKFSDVVAWLKANATKAESVSSFGSHGTENKVAPITKNNEMKFQLPSKSVFAQGGSTSSSITSWTASVPSKSPTPVFGNQNSAPISFSGTQSPAPVSFSGNQNPAPFSFSGNQSSAPFSFSGNQSSAPFSFSENQSSASFSFSGNQNSAPISFSGTQNLAPVSFSGNLNSAPTNREATDDPNEDVTEGPSSPSVKKTEEKGITVVHEVKCKLYIKSTDPADKDTWKDRGTGQLSIKCKEGVSKATKDSKPTIVVRNDVGKVLLNALIYPGIKTNLLKNAIAAIFHSSIEAGGKDSGATDTVTARTYLIRTKTEEERNKLASAIQEYAPTA